MTRVAAAAAVLTLFCLNLTHAQKVSDALELELIGPVKVVCSLYYSFLLKSGEYVEVGPKPTIITQVFDQQGTLLFELGERICGNEIPDSSKRTYDRNGNVAGYLPNDTIEHSSYRLRHIYDTTGRRIETEEYDPYRLTNRWTYKYESFDERGNWTARTVIRANAAGGKFAKTLELRSIEYH